MSNSEGEIRESKGNGPKPSKGHVTDEKNTGKTAKWERNLPQNGSLKPGYGRKGQRGNPIRKNQKQSEGLLSEWGGQPFDTCSLGVKKKTEKGQKPCSPEIGEK